ncbi:hypothetical protein E1B28_012172 [Marasmius oreades]|uniref:L-ornithine N(5)-monooxygenase [NAD(P)H] n=1 Tax=Marasmius oreades TaxID=181124 RepID=A0A9P7RQX6_9AGAR|nr:uncharacterized protein E1B28_012172 [Marasmius oreades]KAG7088151.1 hypothetical protein E1B28_012172 [Marasmius oreades]
MTTDPVIYDLLGLGFGPANIAIAGAIVESWANPSCHINKVLFIEKHHVFRWHPGMLLPGAKMQISFMKDLATLRNPQSPITFLSYLHSEGRLLKFINRGGTVPTRKEYADYIGWAARYVESQGVPVHWGTEIIGLDDGKEGTILVHAKSLATGEVTVHRTRNLIIAPGGAPNIPRTFETIYKDPLFVHSSEYATSIDTIFQTIGASARPVRIAVVGSGQSAAEVTLNLNERLSKIPVVGGRHRIEMIIRKGSLKPSDDSPFANEIFDPDSTDAWFSMPSAILRSAQLKEYKGTNYGVVNPKTIDVLYELMYDQQVDERISSRPGEQQLSDPFVILRPYTLTLAATQSQDASTVNPYVLTYQHAISGAITTEEYDAVICATGYKRTAWIDLLKSCQIGKHFGLDPTTDASQIRLAPETELHRGPSQMNYIQSPADVSGASSPMSSSASNTPPTSPSLSHISLPSPTLYISRNYRVLPNRAATGEVAFKPKIYVQGVEEATHGLSDTLLSVMGIRAGEVVADLMQEDA